MSRVAIVRFSVEVTKITSRIGVSSTHKLPFSFEVILKLSEMVILSKLALPILETFILISFIVDLSLNQTLLIYQFSVTHTWKTRPIFKKFI